MASDPRWKAPYRKARAQLNARSKRCHWCGRPAAEADHLVPVKDGGSHDLANLVPACRSCNASRGARSPEEWRGAQRVAAVTIFARRDRVTLKGDYRRHAVLRRDYTR